MIRLLPLLFLTLACSALYAAEKETFQPMDVFQLELANEPAVAPDGKRIAYVRQHMDIMADRTRSSIWIVNADGSGHEPLVTGNADYRAPRWSPDGERLLFVSTASGKPQLHVRYLDSGRETQLTRGVEAPANAVWSPDGKWIAFNMQVPAEEQPFVKLPQPPKGAEWAPQPKYIDELLYRADGQGYLEEKYSHVFVIPAEGGTPRQLTDGRFNHGPPAWSADGRTLYTAANRQEDWRFDPVDAEIYAIDLASGELTALTERDGPDNNPRVSPDGARIAYTGFDDRKLGYHVTRLYVMDADGGGRRVLTAGLDRDVESPVWDEKGRGLYFLYDSEGISRVGYVSLAGEVRKLADGAGGLSWGRPYTGAALDAAGGTLAFTQASVERPAELAVVRGRGAARRVTDLNGDLIGQRRLGKVEEFWLESSADSRRVQAWLIKPPGFDPDKKYPLILEIHGGPFAAYGPIFAAELQLYAARGYLVLYVNPRGSTSYGAEFANLIHHNYPGQDYDDLMSAVDAVIERGYVGEDQLFVTGGSGGGVLSAWIVGKTDRFRAAVVVKPVINWTSFALTADFYTFFHQYWFQDYPWNAQTEYWRRSPLSLVGEVSTPTMLMTGEQDYRTPISETEQFYQALKLRKVDTALVRVPEAPHFIARRPSHLIAKVEYILAWFEKYRKQGG